MKYYNLPRVMSLPLRMAFAEKSSFSQHSSAACSPRGHGVAGHPSDAARLSEAAVAAVPATGRGRWGATDRAQVDRVEAIPLVAYGGINSVSATRGRMGDDIPRRWNM